MMGRRHTMSDREDVCKWLRKRLKIVRPMSETGKVYKKILALLHEQEPRIINIEELHALRPGDNVWREWWIITDTGNVRTGIELCVVTPELDLVDESGSQYLPYVVPHSDPDWKERYWTREPTEEQRKAVKWHAGE